MTPRDASNRHPSPTRPARSLTRVVQWEDRTAWPLFVAAVVMLAATTWFVSVEDAAPLGQGIVALVVLLLWAVFIADYLIRLVLAGRDRSQFVRSRALDPVTLLLPFLRPLLIVVYVWRLPYFRYGGPARQRARYLVTLILFSLLFVYLASWGVWLVERDAPGATIVSFDDALFWGFTTISTVGYGDFVPITPLGRVLAVGLMLGGIVVIGVTSATLISSLNERIRVATGIDPVLRRPDGRDAGRG